jgi:PRC-barrel domain
MQSNTGDESTPLAGVSGAGSIAAPAADAHVRERNDKAQTTSAPDRDWGPKGRVQSTVMLAAAKAVDVDGTLIGDVTDLMVDIVTGRIAYVVVSVGAMLGLGGERYAVPWSALSYDAETGVFRLRFAKSALADAPLVEREFWPEMTDDERWARAVHEHFRAIPYWAS